MNSSNLNLQENKMMGLFDKFKKNDKKAKENEEAKAPGWDAITEECERAYPSQTKTLSPACALQTWGKRPVRRNR